jgi:SecD/SecF fusion protein
MLTGIVLFIFGTGPIKGFATTLIIGIITSLITGFVLSRFFYDFVFKSEKLNKKLTFLQKLPKIGLVIQLLILLVSENSAILYQVL